MHVDAVEEAEDGPRPARQPCRISQQQIVADRGCRGLQVQRAPLRVDGGDFVAIRFQHTAHLIDAGVVCPRSIARRIPDGRPRAHAAVSGARRFHPMRQPIFLQRIRDPGCLGAPGCAPGRVMIATSSRAIAVSSMNLESDVSRPGGKPLDRHPRRANTLHGAACCARADSMSMVSRSGCVQPRRAIAGLMCRE